jgi:hypothetical protein
VQIFKEVSISGYVIKGIIMLKLGVLQELNLQLLWQMVEHAHTIMGEKSHGNCAVGLPRT